nr:YciI family protein [Stenotrophomonas maltophilia]
MRTRQRKRGNAVWYVIEGYDGQDVLAQRLQARPEHLARLYALRDEGRLLLAGPCPAVDSEDPGPAGFSGSVVIAQFESLVQAQAWADADPYVAAGVYTHVQVRPFRKVLP